MTALHSFANLPYRIPNLVFPLAVPSSLEHPFPRSQNHQSPFLEALILRLRRAGELYAMVVRIEAEFQVTLEAKQGWQRLAGYGR